jgi:Ca-activated chloride channel homolog
LHGDAQSGATSAGAIVAAVVAAALVALGLFLFLGREGQPTDGSAQPGTGPAPADRADCTQVVIAASPEKAGVLGQAVQTYNASNPEVDGSCVFAQVLTKGSGTAAAALARGWDEDVDGPRPHVWSPAASAWGEVATVQARELDQPDIFPSTGTSIATSPLVIAMPQPMAEALGWPDVQVGWGDLAELAADPAGWGSAGHPEWGAFRLGKTNPNFSTSGLNATIGTYFAATGTASDLTVDMVGDPATTEFVSGVESAVVHYGDTTLTFLSNLLRADREGRGLSYVSAVSVEEKSVLDYNRGNPAADPELTDTQPPSIPLVAMYPAEGTLVSDNPWFVLEAPWVDAATRAAAQDLEAHLLGEESQQLFLDEGFRGADGSPGPQATLDNGLLADEPQAVLTPPSGEVLDAVLRSWEENRKPAKVLMVLDVSGSMGDTVSGSGLSRLGLAQAATLTALDGFAEQDEIGLWIFSSEQGQNSDVPYTPLVEIAPAETSLPQIEAVVPNLIPNGGTALYATTKAAHAALEQEASDRRIEAVVLLTDGVNEHPDNDLAAVVTQLQTEPGEPSVRVFTIGYGEDADQQTLQAIAEASDARSYNASDPLAIEQVMIDVISNF